MTEVKLEAPTLLQAVRAHRSEVTCLDMCGARLVTGGGDRTLRLWTWAGGAGWTQVGEVRAAHRYGVTAARWSSAGVLVASGGVDGAARVWSGPALVAVRALAAPGAAAVRALCWASGGGIRLVAGHDDGTVFVWAAARGALLARLPAHEGALHALSTPARGLLLLTACTHGVLKVYDLVGLCNGCEGHDGNGTMGSGSGVAPLLWVDGAHDLGALCADAAEDGSAATGGHDARIRLWRAYGDSPRLRDVGALEGHTAAVTALRWARDFNFLASASLDRSARLWAPATLACLHVLQAHPRYLTCIALAPDLRSMITGSNDKSFRMWSLGSMTIDDELEPVCTPLSHFALGDLEGIGPVETDDDLIAGEGEAADSCGEGGTGTRRVWCAQAHNGAINSVATYGDHIATASSDGSVKLWRWIEEDGGEGGALLEEHTLEAHRYPAMAADFGASGTVLLTAGLDGCAFVWDVKSGVQLRALSVPGGAGEVGGGGVRGARISPRRRPSLLLLATDDGLAPLWTLTDPDPLPLRVYGGHAEAATCCAWSGDGRVAATGAASGELRLLAPPAQHALYHRADAHDLGVLSCDFASNSSALDLPEDSYMLATAGCDAMVKFWRIDLEEVGEEGEGWKASVQLVRQLEAHGGAVAGVRWASAEGGGAMLATAGADRWARVWRIRGSLAGGVRADACASTPVRGAGGAPTAALLMRGSRVLLAVGSLTGELALWRLPPDAAAYDDDDETASPRFWMQHAVLRWLRDFVLHSPGSRVCPDGVAVMEAAVSTAGLIGVDLLDEPIDTLLQHFGYGDENISEEGGDENKEVAGRREVRERIVDELKWLRRDPPPLHVEAVAPHALLCPLTHRLLRWPVRAADGFTYERSAFNEWLLAAPPDGAVSPISGRRLRSTLVAPNYGVGNKLRVFLQEHE